jgi:alpha-mannosidase
MPSEDIHAVVARWRRNVKGKFRGIASFEERADLRFNAIKDRIYKRRVTVDQWEIRQARYRGWGDYQFVDADWRPIRVGATWGGDDMSAFFRQRIVVPPEMEGEKIALHLFLGGDSLLKVNGVPHHGMDIFRSEVLLRAHAKAGEILDIEVESYMNYGGSSPRENELLASELVAIDGEIRDAYWDLWCAAKMLSIPEMDAPLKDFIEFNLWEAMKLIPLREADGNRFRDAVLQSRRMVRDTIYASDRFKKAGIMDLVGHSHLDVVFMWPYKEFIRKIGRTHATMLRLMDEYPEFRFCQSQAKIYADLKRYYPDLFAQIQRRVAEGRWDIVGALWVEPDCNLISGESFVRQILHGQRFFKENFGRVSRACWQPDVFGVTWALPQILARAGIRYFVTNKMVPWNDTNPWTLNTFWWEGFDGSRVLGIVPPGHFMGTVDPDVIDRQWRGFADKDTVGETLHVYGWGDGGGGVDPEMVESALRYRNFPGLPAMRFSGPEEAFDSIAAKARNARLPVLRDEIYLEAHRGTYTHKGRIKKLNRRAELLFREAEMLAALAWARGAPYPSDALNAGWEDLLTTQFHDALPGTHVPAAYADILKDYERIFGIGEKVRSDALSALAPSTAQAAAPAAAAASLCLFNSLLAPRGGYATAPAAVVSDRAVTDLTGHPLPQQDIERLDGTRARLFRLPMPVPSVGFARLGLRPRAARPAPAASCPTSGPDWLENEFLSARFNADGELVSLYDKQHHREVLPPNEPGNRFLLFEDTPGKYDAWDIVETYQDHPIDISGNATLTHDETGPLRASLRLEKRFGGSRLVQRIGLAAGERQLTFETQVDWVERQRLLKVAFPVDIVSAFATYDISFGNMPRPTHANTSYDRAKFEVPAHQWMDLSQTDYGVSLLNDCKYGCDARGRTMRLTLLKGSIHPDPNADVETHHFTYALYPHAGDWRRADTIGVAMALNHPLLVGLAAADPHGPAPTDEAHGALLACGAPNVTLEAIKRSEDGRELILRLVERHGATTRSELVFDRPVRKAWSCNLMEENERDLAVEGARVPLFCRPHEIVTLRLALA